MLPKYDSVKEADIVANFGKLRAGKREEMEGFERMCSAAHKVWPKKIILETDALTVDQVKEGCQCCSEAGADFVKDQYRILNGGF